jgi:hypothetical protein
LRREKNPSDLDSEKEELKELMVPKFENWYIFSNAWPIRKPEIPVVL